MLIYEILADNVPRVLRIAAPSVFNLHQRCNDLENVAQQPSAQRLFFEAFRADPAAFLQGLQKVSFNVSDASRAVHIGSTFKVVIEASVI